MTPLGKTQHNPHFAKTTTHLEGGRPALHRAREGATLRGKGIARGLPQGLLG